MDLHEILRGIASLLCLAASVVCIGALLFFDERMSLWRKLSLAAFGAGLFMRAFGIAIGGEPIWANILIAAGALSHQLCVYRPSRWLHLPTRHERTSARPNGAGPLH